MADEQNDANNRESALPEEMRDPGFWREAWHQIRLVFALLRDPDVPSYLKLLPLAAVLYVLFPLDFAPDFWPVLGQLDDLTAVLVGAKVFIEMAPPHVVARHMALMHGAPAEDEVKEKDPLEDAIIVDVDHELIGDKPRGQMKENE